MSNAAHAHRAGESGDYAPRRHGMDPTMKKLLFSLLALLLSVVGVLLGFDRSDIKGDATSALSNTHENSIGINLNKAQIQLVQKDVTYLREDVEDLKDGQKTMVRGMQQIIDTLYIRPDERRRNAKPVLEAPE